jgi:hypothetical protein
VTNDTQWIRYSVSLAVVLVLLNLNPMFGQTPFVAYSAAGPDATSIAPVVNAFRNVLGTNNGNASGAQPGGRREINWDGGGDAALATVFPNPMTNFNAPPTTRGAVFTGPAPNFEISGQNQPRFGDLNVNYPGIFTTFSAPRLFTALGSNITDVRFFIPGTNTPSTVNAFGAVFTDVDLPESTSLEYFDVRGNSLGRAFVPPANAGLSFVGLIFSKERIGRVRITSGNTAPGPGANDGGSVDVVVMDDFIYGEPFTIGPPTDKDQCKDGGWLTFNFPRTFRNQGDCIQFVNTGK